MTVFRNLLIAKSTATRPYYCEVEYLDAPNNTVNAINTQGAAYIDTEIVPDDTTIMEARVQFNILNTNNREQLNGSTAVDARFAFGFGSVQPYTNFYAGLTTQNLATSVPRDLNPHTFILDALNKTITIDGTTEAFTTAGSFGETDQSIYLFARNITTYQYANKPMNGKVYYCKITKNGSLVRDMIPVLDLDMEPCMYDKVSGRLFYSVGTGVFVAGRQIHPVEYLGFTGTQYIDTDLFAASDLKVECECSTSTADGFNNPLFGGREATTVNSFTVWKHLVGSESPRFDFANNQRFATNAQQADVWYTITKDGADNYIDDVPQTSNQDVTFESETTKIIIGGVRSGTSTFSYLHFQGKIKSAKCWKAGVLKYDFIPAIDENDTYFMFDRVNHTIHDNAGTGDFVGGPTKE